jgi:hypothetical protein
MDGQQFQDKPFLAQLRNLDQPDRSVPLNVLSSQALDRDGLALWMSGNTMPNVD